MKMGFVISEIKDIFNNSDRGEEIALEVYINNIFEELHDFSFKNNFLLSKEDEAIVYYTTGYVAQGLLKHLKCSACKDLLSAGREVITVDIDDTSDVSIPEKQEYIALVNRGGLSKPFDLLHVTCLHTWSLYAHILEKKDCRDILFSCTFPRDAFVRVLVQLLKNDDH